MILTRLASTADNVTMAVLAVLLLGVFVARPIASYILRKRRRSHMPLRAEAALCRRLRRVGHLYHPTGPELRSAFAATRARLVEQMHRGGQR